MSYIWSWPTDDPDRALSAGGDSDAHIARIGHAAMDVPAWPVRGAPCPARVYIHQGAVATVAVVVGNPDLSDCGRQLDYTWDWDWHSWRARICHWDQIDVRPGDTLDAETWAGTMGASGAADGVHAHIAVWCDGEYVRPEDVRFDEQLPAVEEPPMPTLEERVAALEQENERLRQFGLNTAGNAYLLGDRDPSNPVKLMLGRPNPDEPDHPVEGLYLFFQERFPGQAQGENWSGIRTSVRSKWGRPVAEMYGAGAMDLWGQNVRAAPDGTVVSRTFVTEKLYLDTVRYRNLKTGEFVVPSSWSPAGEPLDEAGDLLGGIMYGQPEQGALRAFLAVVDGRLALSVDGVLYEIMVRPWA